MRALVRAGVPLMTGSDAIGPMWVPGWASQEELRIFVNDVGMTPYQALRAATTVPAAFLREANDVGTITPGKRADLVLLDGNPLTDIRAAERIAGVMVRGRWMSKDYIARRLEGVERDNARTSRQAADVVSLGWQRAARARCDPTSPASSEAVRPIVELAIQSGFADRMRDVGPSRAMSEADVIGRECPEARVFNESKINQVANELNAAGRVPEAIHVLEANLQQFPKSFLAPYWLAERQLAAGDTSAAIVSG